MEQRREKGLLALCTPTNGSFISLESTDCKSVLVFVEYPTSPTMNTSGLQQNFILFLEKTKTIKEAPKILSERLCCEKCRFSTKDPALFERHVAQHEEVTFSCTICNHISYSRVESQRHLVKHKGSFPYKCNWCSYGAVRRDYMVKHIQRIHGKSADGIVATKKMEAVQGRCLPAPRTLAGPSHSVKVVSHSAGTVSSLISGAVQTRPSAPHRVTSTTCGLPIIKPQAYVVTSPTHTGLVNPPNVTAKEAGPAVSKAMKYINKRGEKTFLENTALTSALPRVHVGIYGDRSVQQKPPLQSQVVGTTEKAESNTMPKIQVGLPVSNNNHLRTLLSNQREGPVAPTQKSVISGVVQNIPVAHVSQRSVPSLSNTTIPVERFRQEIPSTKHVVQTPGKNKTRTNTLLRPTPPLTVKSSTKPGGDVGLLAPLNQPSPHKRPMTISGPEERNSPRSNVQVELLAPLNQPIQHNKPLTVSCPEEITIPAGCLVELVEVKTVNGTRELELRLVPQQLPGPQLRDLNSTRVTSTTNRLSFKCRVTTDGNEPVNTNQEIDTTKANALPEHLVQQSHLKKLLDDVKVNVKNETDVNERVLCFKRNKTQGPGTSSKLFHAVSRSVVSNTSESHRFMQQLCAEQKKVAPEPVTPLCRMHCPVKNISPHASNKNSKTEGLKYKLTAAQPPTNTREDAELGYQGLPVISSVFSLCPISQDTLSHFPTREKDAQMSVVSGSKKNLNNTDNSRVCRPTVKTEDETRLLTDGVQKAGQLAVQKDNVLEVPKAPEETVKENRDTMAEKTYAKVDEDTILSQHSSSSTDAPQTDTATSMNSSPVSKSDNSTQPEKTDKGMLESEKSLLTQTDGPLVSYLNPRVTLIRMPTLEFSSLSESANKEKRDGEESITARPVVCCMSNQRNLQERTIKLVLKRKRSETKTGQDDGMDLVCIDLPPTNKKARKEKRKAKKHKSTKEQPLFGKGTMAKMCLMPLKDDQLVKCPGPTQPVVVLNHPNPLVQMVSVEGRTLNNQHCRNLTPAFCNQDGAILSNPVRARFSVKMTLKKVQGQTYQVTELLLKGVAEKTVL